MEWWLLCWLVLFTRTNPCLGLGPHPHCKIANAVSQTITCMKELDKILKNGNLDDSAEALKKLQQTLEETNVALTTYLSESRFVVLMHKPSKGPSIGLEFHANKTKAKEGKAFNNSNVRVRVPRELEANNTIVFSMITWPEASRFNLTASGEAGVLHESRLFGLSVRGKEVSALKEPINITLTLPVNEIQKPRCVFFNFSTSSFSSAGCETQWKRGQSNIDCICYHLTFFGVLMVFTSSVSPNDLEILSYITVIGCSLSLFALCVTVLLFITNRKVRKDVSMKVHINLAIALILLNLHFLPSQWVASLSSTGLCLYVALSLHYFLLASFCWMAVEGFHLYLLLVRVFNIYVRRYLLKLSVVGWGVPAVIVGLVAAFDTDSYGRVRLDSSDPNSTEVCYIVDATVKMVTTVGVFGLVFVFNMIMLVVTVRCIVGLRPSVEVQFGQNDCNRVKREACTLLGVTTLLGTTWGLVFFSFGSLTTTSLYLFCILNPLQGFFIFLWFVMSWRKIRNPTTDKSSVTPSTIS